MKTNKAIVLCAGMSSRMKKLVSGADLPESLKEEALNKPKSMIGLGPQQEPFLVYLI
jgi:NDP-sugar pyrophosphorylase family protein